MRVVPDAAPRAGRPEPQAHRDRQTWATSDRAERRPDTRRSAFASGSRAGCVPAAERTASREAARPAEASGTAPAEGRPTRPHRASGATPRCKAGVRSPPAPRPPPHRPAYRERSPETRAPFQRCQMPPADAASPRTRPRNPDRAAADQAATRPDNPGTRDASAANPTAPKVLLATHRYQRQAAIPPLSLQAN